VEKPSRLPVQFISPSEYNLDLLSPPKSKERVKGQARFDFLAAFD
jgi:hypothetical protein